MSGDLRDLYQQVILDHQRSARNFHALPQANRESQGHNPLCGDKVTVYVDLEGDVAVAHYLYTSASEDKDDNVEISNGRYTDVLIRTDDGWKFIAWHGGDDDQN